MTCRTASTLVSVIVSAAAFLVPTGAAAAAEPVPLERAVSDAVVAAKAGEAVAAYGVSARAVPEPLVEPKRSAGVDWVFGGSVFPIPDDVHADPVTSLFLAERDAGGSWRVALEGSGEFARLAAEAPAELFVDEGERASLAALPRAANGSPALALPWREGQGGWRHSGVHGAAVGPGGVYNAVDFYGGDGLVRASAGGYLYRFCSTENPYLQVRHPGGWTTGYYHQRELTNAPDGSWVDAYDVLGVIAEEVPCGGAANRPHVHWALLRDGEPVAVDGKTVGGWTWHAAPANYAGYAERGPRKLYGHECCLTNHGAHG